MKKICPFILLFILISNQVFAIDEAGYTMPDDPYYITLTFGLSVPSNPLTEIMVSGINANICFGYNLPFDWFILGVGVYAGCIFESTTSDVLYFYDMLSFPIAVNLKFTPNFTFPVNLFVELNGGVALNFINYPDYTVTIFVLKPFISASLGFGGYILPHVRISQYFSFILILFSDPSYMAFSPGLRIGVGF
ncbi:MAG: hypothetical protein JW822_06585 [Spirochaetales bacterium]|nr:hypothetical protein [Spirochaetales bacterium]